MKTYEGLFILNSTGKEDGIKETIDKISAEIVAAGGKVETVQKMDKRPFSRVADKKFNTGFYVNVIFATSPASVAHLRSRFALIEDVFRVLFTEAATPKKASKPA